MNKRRARRLISSPLTKELLQTGLFVKTAAHVSVDFLRLKETRFFLMIPRVTSEPKDLAWKYMPPGSLFGEDPNPFYRGRPSHAITSVEHEARNMETIEVFDEAPPEIVEKLAFYINLLP